MTSLTHSQSLALEDMVIFFNSEEKYFRLTGYAGTGKSFLISCFVKWLKTDTDYVIIAAAPTNKAAKNLRIMMKDTGIETTTIAKLLGLIPELNEKTGKEEFVEINGRVEADIVIVDEFSMINKETFIKIQSLPGKIIFVGDVAQLPPVGEKESIVQQYSMPNYNLTQVMRYDGELAKVAEIIRNDDRYNKIVYPFKTSPDLSIMCLSRAMWLDMAGQIFSSKDFLDNADYCRVIAWKNKTVDQINIFIRNCIWGVNPPSYVVGDRLIVKKPIFRKSVFYDKYIDKNKEKNAWIIIVNNSDECVVTNVTVGYDNQYQWEYYLLDVLADNTQNHVLRVLTDAAEIERQKKIKYHNDNKQFRAALNLDKLYDNIGYAYAITTHKAQGSTIEYVFIDTMDMNCCPDLQKIQYTALTRAKKSAIIPV